MSGWKDWGVGEVVEESDFQTYVQNQVVQVYADSTARGSALGTAVSEGMVSYLQDTDSTEVYTGASWQAIGGDITAVTAGTALTGGGTSGAVTLNVDQSKLFTDGTSGFTMVSGGTAGVTYQPISHNYIINGAFDIWQRGTSFSGLTTKQYTADRWEYDPSGATASITREAFTPAELTANGFGEASFYLKFDVTTANDFVELSQKIEDVRTLAGQPFTASFYAKGVLPTSPALLNLRIVQNFGTGGSASVNAEILTVTSLTSEWQRFTVTGTMPSISGKTIGANSHILFRIVQVGPQSTTPWEISIWGVQLEAGSVATPFRRNANSIQGELAACQRYYQKFTFSGFQLIAIGQTDTTTVGHFIMQYPVEMRVAPTGAVTGAFRIKDGGTARSGVTVTFGGQSPLITRLIGTLGSAVLTLGRGLSLENNNDPTTAVEFSAEL